MIPRDATLLFRTAERPLAEPGWRPRSKFEPNMLTKTMRQLRREGAHLGADHVVIEVDGPLRQDGFPAVTKLRTPAIRVFIESKHGPLRYDVDTYAVWEDNLRALALALEALRAVDRYGVTSHGEQYTGWKALPPGQVSLGAGTNMSAETARTVLAAESGLSIEEVAGASPQLLARIVREAKAKAHPDRHGGDRSAWNAVEEAARVVLPEQPS